MLLNTFNLYFTNKNNLKSGAREETLATTFKTSYLITLKNGLCLYFPIDSTAYSLPNSKAAFFRKMHF